MFDFLDTKKKAPGERKPVFPEGVPGITQGVPKEMVRGSAGIACRRRSAGRCRSAAGRAQPAPPPAKRSRTAAKRPAPAEPAQVEIAPDDVNVEDEAPPPPPRRSGAAARNARTSRRPTQQANPFPAPLPR